jgi:hypothetical protein
MAQKTRNREKNYTVLYRAEYADALSWIIARGRQLVRWAG